MPERLKVRARNRQAKGRTLLLPSGAVLSFGHPDAGTLKAVLARFQAYPLGYTTPGMTAYGSPPAGMQAEASVWPLGVGEATFDAAGDALFAWATHDLRWMNCRWLGHFSDGPPTPGRTVVLNVGLGPLRLLCGCRVLETWRTDTGCGYRYGTLPGHPERGEEAFEVRRQGQAVRLVLRAYSRPAGLLFHLARPVSLGLRRAGSQGYGENLRRAARYSPAASPSSRGMER